MNHRECKNKKYGYGYWKNLPLFAHPKQREPLHTSSEREIEREGLGVTEIVWGFSVERDRVEIVGVWRRERQGY